MARRSGASGASIHLAVDAATHAIVAAEVSLETVADNEVLPNLLNPLRRKCSGQLKPDTWLGRPSAFAGAIPSLC